MIGDAAVSVVVCAYTMDRWGDLCAAVESLLVQTLPPHEIVIVIDHNPELLARARIELTGVSVIPSTGAPGLSGGRNTGIAATSGDVIAFLDDDAVADSYWIECLAAPYRNADVVAVGGRVEPSWDVPRPVWLPPEFDWVIGCTYAGHREDPGEIRNVIGANMSLRRAAVDVVGGFVEGIGRSATLPEGCEETEWCIRARQEIPGAIVWYAPDALVGHRVTVARTRPSYFFRRCFAEGRSKTRVSRLVGAGDGLASERAHALVVLPTAFGRELQSAARSEPGAAWSRAGALVGGLAATTAGAVSALARSAPRAPEPEPEREGFVPARTLTIDLDGPLRDLAAVDPATGRRYERAVVLVRRGGRPVRVVDLDLDHDGLDASVLAARIGVLDAPTVLELDPPTTPATVVIATHDRPESLAACLESVLAQDHVAFEIVVVDNAPSSDATLELLTERYLDEPRIRYVREPVAGLARAHNRGLLEVETPIVAFTDDDVLADPEWLRNLVSGFGDDLSVGCVTGLIFPVELETQAQEWLEGYAGYAKGLVRSAFDLHANRPEDALFPWTAGTLGSGANMAFRTDLLRRFGGFDDALGAGSIAMGGDDLAAFFDVVMSGATLVYEPAAVVYHRHRRGYDELRTQAYGYGVGLGAYITRTVVQSPRRLLQVVPRAPRAAAHVLHPRSEKNRRLANDYPAELRRRERLGMLAGPARYIKSRRRMAGVGPVGRHQPPRDGARDVAERTDASVGTRS